MLLSTNQHFYRFISSCSLLWQGFLNKYFPYSYKNYRAHNDAKELYKHLTMIKHNILKGEYQSKKLKAHEGSISCMVIDKGRLISGSNDCTIKIWDLKKEEPVKVLSGHTGLIKNILVDKQKYIISSSGDCTIKIWDPKKEQPLRRTLSGHEGSISCMVIGNRRLISSSDDGTIKIWKIWHTTHKKRRVLAKKIEVPETLNGGQGPISCISTHKNKRLISGSNNGTIKIWDIKEKKELRALKGHESMIKNILVHKNTLISADNHTIKIWNIQSGDTLHTLSDNKDKEISSILIHEGNLISVHEKTINIWDIQKGKNLQKKLNVQERSAIISVLAHEDKLFVALANQKITIWDIQNRKKLQTLTRHNSSWVSHILMYDNNLIFSSSDGIIRIWNFNPS
jgi:WD40 repeat protein